MAEEFYSFDKVLRELQMEEEVLKRLVSEGEIRAFRDEDKMKFKREDIERFKGATPNLPTVEAHTDELTDADLFGDDDGASGDIGMVTQQISSDTFLDDDVVEAFDDVEPQPRGGRKAAGRSAAAAAAKPARRRVEVEQATEGTGMQVALVLSAIVLIYGVIVVFNAAEVHTTGLTQGWANWISDTFLK